MKALIDGDVVTYQCGFASDQVIYECPDGTEFQYKKEAIEYCNLNGQTIEAIEKHIEPEPVEHCLHSVKIFLNKILEEVDADSHEILLTGPVQARKLVYPEYKANRDPTHKPFWYDKIHEYLVTTWNADLIAGSEADDAMAWKQWADPGTRAGDQFGAETCICTIDKDLNMVPGFHYNWKANAGAGDLYWVEETSANMCFFEQWLTGDSADNIPGLKGWGPVKAQKYLKGLPSYDPKMLARAVWAAWQKAPSPAEYNKAEWVNMIGDLLWMQRTPGETWDSFFGVPRFTSVS